MLTDAFFIYYCTLHGKYICSFMRPWEAVGTNTFITADVTHRFTNYINRTLRNLLFLFSYSSELQETDGLKPFPRMHHSFPHTLFISSRLDFHCGLIDGNRGGLTVLHHCASSARKLNRVTLGVYAWVSLSDVVCLCMLKEDAHVTISWIYPLYYIHRHTVHHLIYTHTFTPSSCSKPQYRLCFESRRSGIMENICLPYQQRSHVFKDRMLTSTRSATDTHTTNLTLFSPHDKNNHNLRWHSRHICYGMNGRMIPINTGSIRTAG